MEKEPILTSYTPPLTTATTHGIRIEVDSFYMPELSTAQASDWQFGYEVTITNEGEKSARLVSRHWVITDALGDTQTIQGLGVLGEQPRLASGESYSYMSQCKLKTPFGGMQGIYTMLDEDGTRFDAKIPPFVLAQPNDIN